MMRTAILGMMLAAVALATAVGVCGCADSSDPAADIVSVMREAEAGWNAGDLEQYMDCYRRSDSLRFAGGATVSTGWETVLANYQRTYPDRAAMGRLTFSDLDVTLLADDAAMVFGRWRLDREGEAIEDAPYGLFTLLLRRLDAGWRIVHDHTSAAR